MLGNEKSVTITVGPDGKSVIEAHGYNGTGCMDATKAFELLFNDAGAKRTMKNEIGAGGGDANVRITG